MQPINNNNPAGSALSAEFHLRARQALLASQQSARQVALLVIDLEDSANRPVPPGETQSSVLSSLLMGLRNDLRESDTVMALSVSRIGALLSSISGREDIDRIIQRVRKGLKQSFEIDGVRRDLEPRVGIAVYPEHGNDAATLVQCAEDALNEAKTTGRLYAIYSSASNGWADSHHWMSELRQAIVSDQLSLLYQPKISLVSGKIVGVEVLTRWRHPKHGTIVPEKFIPVAERTGLIIPLTLRVLQQSLRQCREWRDMGSDVNIAVNLTMWNLETHELPGQITALLRDTGVPARNLELEITESAIMSDPERVIKTLKEIRDLGVQFAIDDFGTGYSSFAHLKRLPVGYLKIDKSFLFNIENDRDNSLIVRSIIDLAHNLRLKVVAEGVETRSAKDLIASCDCDEGQGFFFSPPVSADAITKMLSESTRTHNRQPAAKAPSWLSQSPVATSPLSAVTDFKSK